MALRLRAKFPAAPPRSGVGSKIPGTGVPEWSQAANSRKRKGRNRENPNGKPSGSEHFSNGILRASLSSAGRVPEAKVPSCIEISVPGSEPLPGSGLFPANGTAALRSGCCQRQRGCPLRGKTLYREWKIPSLKQEFSDRTRVANFQEQKVQDSETPSGRTSRRERLIRRNPRSRPASRMPDSKHTKPPP